MSTRFSASGQHYTSTTGIISGSSFTMMCWAWLSADRNDWSCMLAFENQLSGASRWFELVTDGDGTSITFSTSGGTTAMGTVAVGEWHRFAVEVTASTATVYYGADTGPLSTATGACDSIATVVPTTFFVGTDSFGEWWNGRIACARVWNAALTQTELDAEFASYDAVRTANLLRNHKLQAPSTADDSGNGNTLTGGAGASAEADPPIVVPSVALPRPPVVGPSAAVMRAAW
jgi:hypothetical protein